MVNFRDPAIARKDYRAHVVHDLHSAIRILMKIYLASDSQEPLSYYMRHIPVRSYPMSPSRSD